MNLERTLFIRSPYLLDSGEAIGMGNVRSRYGVLGAWSTTLHDPQDPIGVHNTGERLSSAANAWLQVHSGCSISIPLKNSVTTVIFSELCYPYFGKDCYNHGCKSICGIYSSLFGHKGSVQCICH